MEEGFEFRRDKTLQPRQLGLRAIDAEAIADLEIKVVIAMAQIMESEAKAGFNQPTIDFIYPDGVLSIDALKTVVRNWEVWQRPTR